MAELMGHVKVDTTLNVYTQTLSTALRDGSAQVSAELFSIVQSPAGARALIH